MGVRWSAVGGNAFALAVSVAACGLVAYSLSQAGWVRARLRQAGLTPTVERIGIWQDDPRFGYRHRPSSSGVHRTSEFAVRYTIDEQGCRAVERPQREDREIVFLGDSFTFGHGVEDHEAYPALLAGRHWPNAEIRNCGVMGWGTGQAYLALQERLAGEAPPDDVVYGWTSADLQRNYLRRSWLATLDASGRRNVHFETQGDRVVLRGTAGLELAVPDEAPHLADREMEVTRALLRAMASLAAERSVSFAVALLPSRQSHDEIGDWLATRGRAEGIAVVDLRDVRGPYFKRDGHPKAVWHAAIAAAMARRMRGRVVRTEAHRPSSS